jgi:hypothetical protein
MARLTLDWIQIACLVGALQGLFLTGVIGARKNNRTANRILAVLTATFTFYLASTVYFSAGIVEHWPHLFGVAYQLPWVFGPLVYLYAVAASDRSWRFRRQTLIHFVPVALNTLATSPYYFLSGAEKLAMMTRWRAGEIPLQLVMLDPFKYVSGIAYSIATVVYLRRHRRQVEHSYSNTERVNLRWLLFLSSGPQDRRCGRRGPRRAHLAGDGRARLCDWLHGIAATGGVPLRDRRISSPGAGTGSDSAA